MATKRKAEAIDPYYKQFLDHLLLHQKLKYEPNLGSTSTKATKKKLDAEALGPDWAHLLSSDSSVDKYYREYLINLSLCGFDERKKVVEERRQPSSSSSSSSSVGEFPEGGGHDDGSFEERLGRCLAEPFNEEEYEELMREATRRGRVSRCKELRGRSAAFATTEPGLSYLDHYWG